MRERSFEITMPDNAAVNFEQRTDLAYAVEVAVRRGYFILRIKELQIMVQDRDLERALARLRERERLFLEWARSFGVLMELPQRAQPSVF
jgi:hypothetical protein